MNQNQNQNQNHYHHNMTRTTNTNTNTNTMLINATTTTTQKDDPTSTTTTTSTTSNINNGTNTTNNHNNNNDDSISSSSSKTQKKKDPLLSTSPNQGIENKNMILNHNNHNHSATTSSCSTSTVAVVSIFQRNDRVMIVGMNPKLGLNGQHGRITLEGGKLITTTTTTTTSEKQQQQQPSTIDYYSVLLDRLNPIGVRVPAENLRKVVIMSDTNDETTPSTSTSTTTTTGREEVLIKTISPSIAAVTAIVVQNGSLKENGLLLMNVMNLIKWYIANQYSTTTTFFDTKNRAPTNQLSDIQKIPISQRIEYNKYMIQHWYNDTDSDTEGEGKSGGTQQQEGGGVYYDFYKFIYTKGYQMFVHPLQQQFLFQSLNDIHGMKYWNYSFTKDLWFTGRDSQYGTYVIPDDNVFTVYRIVNLIPTTQQQQQQQQQVSSSPSSSSPQSQKSEDAVQQQTSLHLFPIPIRFENVTVLPWYGRLIYDPTTISFDTNQNIKNKATTTLAPTLHAVTLKAIQENTVIDHFTELDYLFNKNNNNHKMNKKNDNNNTTSTSSTSTISGDPYEESTTTNLIQGFARGTELN